MRSRHALATTLLAVLLVPVGAWSEPASSLVARTGTCALALDVARTATAIEIDSPVPGDCIGLDPLEFGRVSLTATLISAIPFQGFDCMHGVAVGPASIETAFGGDERLIDGMEITATVTGEVVTMSLRKADAVDGFVFGAGAFVQTRPAALSCLDDGDEVSWFGTLTLSMPDDSL